MKFPKSIILRWKAVRPDSEGLQDIVVDPQDWYQVKEGSGNDTNNGGLRVSRGQIDGDDDLKVVWMTTWDDDYLYFAFEVTDDNVNEKADAEHPILNDPANGHVAGKQTGIGYNAEVRLPWSIFEPFYGGTLVPEDGMVFGFDITFTDIDPTYAAPEGGAMAWSSDFENDNCPAVLGELFLSTEPAIAGGTAVNLAGKLPGVWGKIKNQ
ncbi:TPA: hypothetical protein EYP66_07410 [Candidatus Poribacteria bacterium]|nr:hypothetical protein [Candidatus Poribacteria bacterium]